MKRHLLGTEKEVLIKLASGFLSENNFIHGLDHHRAVAANALTIARENNQKIRYDLLEIAARWHDVGRNDLKREGVSHDVLSWERLKAVLPDFMGVDSRESKMLEEMIVGHRDRGTSSNCQPFLLEARILKAADKLDIFRPGRVDEILACYRKGIYSPDEEFNPMGSFAFWLSIGGSYGKKFSEFPYAKRYFQKNYSAFSRLVKRRWNEFRNETSRLVSISSRSPSLGIRLSMVFAPGSRKTRVLIVGKSDNKLLRDYSRGTIVHNSDKLIGIESVIKKIDVVLVSGAVTMSELEKYLLPGKTIVWIEALSTVAGRVVAEKDYCLINWEGVILKINDLRSVITMPLI